MAASQLHAATKPQNPMRRGPGPITSGLLKWTRGDGIIHWNGNDGPDAASIVLLRAHALTACLSEAFGEGNQSEFDALNNQTKALAMDAIGDLILLAKIFVDEA